MLKNARHFIIHERVIVVVFMKHIASVSFGKDSTAMLLLLIEKHYALDEVVFFDTGMEFDAIYHVRDQILPLLYAHGIKYVELKPPRPFLYDMLEKPIAYRDKTKGVHCGYGWCGGPCRWGTRAKLDALDRYVKENEAIIYVGMAADEPGRLKRLEPFKRAPLADWQMTEAEALAYCREKGINWNENGIDLYTILDRVSCWCCCNKNLKELRNIREFLPEYWERLIMLQQKIDRPMKRFRKDTQYGDLGALRNLDRYWEETG